MNQRTALDEDFWGALVKKDLPKAFELLSQGANVNTRGYRDEPFIYWAAESNRWDIVDWLASNGADVNAQTSTGETVLHFITKMFTPTYKENLKSFLQYKPNLDIQNKFGVTPLMACVLREQEQVEGVEMLLAAGANPNLKSSEGNTALLISASRSNPLIVELLLKAGASPSISNNQNENSYMVAPFSKEDTLSVLLEQGHPTHSDINQKNIQGVTVLSRAIGTGKFDSFRKLLELGADPNTKDSSGMNNSTSVLMMACALSDTDLVKFIIEKGANVNDKDDFGNNALAYATAYGLWKKIKENIDANANANNVHSSFEQPEEKKEEKLEFNVDLLTLLVESGLNPAQPFSRAGNSPWHETLREKDSIVRNVLWQQLYQLGFTLNNKPVNEKMQNSSVIIDKSNLKPSPLSFAIQKRDMEAINAFLKFGADPGFLGPDGDTPLHTLTKISFSEQEAFAIQLMSMTSNQEKLEKLKNEIELKKIAIENYQLDVATLLNNNMADWGSFDENGQTAVHLIVENNNKKLLKHIWPWFDKKLVNEWGDNLATSALLSGNIEMLSCFSNTEEFKGGDYVLKSVLGSPEDFGKRTNYCVALSTLNDIDAINYRDSDGNTPLIVAAATAQEDVVGVLLKLGVDPNIQNNLGETAIFHAVNADKGDIVQALRKVDADPTIKANNGINAIELADKRRQRHVLNAMDCPDPQEIETTMINEEHKKQIKVLVDNGIELSEQLKATLPKEEPVKTKKLKM
jgi:ankyrin repeat protein